MQGPLYKGATVKVLRHIALSAAEDMIVNGMSFGLGGVRHLADSLCSGEYSVSFSCCQGAHNILQELSRLQGGLWHDVCCSSVVYDASSHECACSVSYHKISSLNQHLHTRCIAATLTEIEWPNKAIYQNPVQQYKGQNDDDVHLAFQCRQFLISASSYSSSSINDLRTITYLISIAVLCRRPFIFCN